MPRKGRRLLLAPYDPPVCSPHEAARALGVGPERAVCAPLASARGVARPQRLHGLRESSSFVASCCASSKGPAGVPSEAMETRAGNARPRGGYHWLLPAVATGPRGRHRVTGRAIVPEPPAPPVEGRSREESEASSSMVMDTLIVNGILRTHIQSPNRAIFCNRRRRRGP